MLDRTALAALLDTGATFAEIAHRNELSLQYVQDLARQHGLVESTFMQVGRSVREPLVRPHEPCDWERLIVDDPDGHVINGIDSRTTNGNLNAKEIIGFYHGDVRCLYTGAVTDMVMPADGSPQNILISNLVPLTEEVLRERFSHTAPVVEDVTHKLSGPNGLTTLTITTEHKFDKMLGGGMNVAHVDEAVSRWVAPYVNNFSFETILERFGCRDTPVLAALWIWTRLEKVALVKGLARIQVERGTTSGYVTKSTLLNQTQQMLQRRFGERMVSPVQTSAMPPAGKAPAPSRLIQL